MLPMDVSLIVTTYNWPDALRVTLASVARQSLMPMQVIVADDGSGSATAAVVAEMAQRLRCEVKHVWQEDKGFRVARVRNLAIAAAVGQYLVQIDGDMVLHRRFIEDHVRCARRDCFIQGARPRLPRELTQRLLNNGSCDVNPFSRGIEHWSYGVRNTALSWLASKAKPSLNGIQACNQSFWRDHAIQINGYDERFTAWGPEDREFSARLLHIGLKRNYVRHCAIAYHLYHESREPGSGNPFDQILNETLAVRRVRCDYGLDAHLR